MIDGNKNDEKFRFEVDVYYCVDKTNTLLWCMPYTVWCIIFCSKIDEISVNERTNEWKMETYLEIEKKKKITKHQNSHSVEDCENANENERVKAMV